MSRRPKVSAILGRALTLRCPNCGIGRPLRGWFRVEQHCSHCGLQIYRESGYFIGAIYISYFLTVAPIVAGFFVLPRFIRLPLATESTLWVVMAILLSLVSVRLGRSLWLAIDFFLDPWSPTDQICFPHRDP